MSGYSGRPLSQELLCHAILQHHGGIQVYVVSFPDPIPSFLASSIETLGMGSGNETVMDCLCFSCPPHLTPKFHSPKLISFNLFIVRSKMSWADQPRSFSDCIAILNAYKVNFVLEDTIVDTYSIHSHAFYNYIITYIIMCCRFASYY